MRLDPLVPTLPDLVAASDRLAAEPGLVAQARTWQLDLPAVRTRLEREAAALASPRVWPDTVGSLVTTVWRVVGAAAPEAPLTLLTLGAASVGLPVAPPDAGAGTIRRAQKVVRAGGPAYVKLGQFIASSDGLLPAEWVEAFAWCRDDAPPLAPGVAEAVVTAELGPGAVELDPEPLAAGSIGQVHTGRLPGGRRVAVKVRRPGLRRAFRRDVETLALITASADRLLPAVQSANLRGFVRLFAELSLQELDFRLEAWNSVEAAAVLDHAGIDAVQVPLPIPGMVTPRVLVMPFVEGVTYDRAAAHLGSALDGRELLRTAIHAVLLSTLVYGVSHGDLHAGNVLVPGPGRFNLLDYGITSRLTDAERESLVRFLVGFATGDAAAQVAGLTAFGAFDASEDRDRLEAELQVEVDALQRRDEGAITFDRLGSTLGRLLRVFARNGFVMPTELVLFFKNLLYLGSFARGVAPEADLFAEVTAVIGEVVAAHPGLLPEDL